MAAPEQTEASVPLFSERILATLKSPGGDDSDSIELLEGALRSVGKPKRGRRGWVFAFMLFLVLFSVVIKVVWKIH